MLLPERNGVAIRGGTPAEAASFRTRLKHKAQFNAN
jgi:hypothetical protein